MKRRLFISFSLLALGLMVGYSPATWAITAQDISSTGSVTTLSAKVSSIDYTTRHVTLETAKGDKLTFKVGKQAKNFEQVKVNDMVKVQYYQSIAWELLPPGSTAAPKVEATMQTASAPKGSTPDVDKVETLSVVGTIESIDQATGTVVLKGPDNKMMPFKVKYPDKLKNLKAGDKVSATLTEAMAISVDPDTGK